MLSIQQAHFIMSDVFFSIGASLLTKIVMLLINIVSFRLLETSEYGSLALILAMANTVVAVSSMGASVAVNSVVAKYGANNVSSKFVKYNYTICIVTSIAMVVFIYIIDFEHPVNIKASDVFVFIFLFALFSSLNSISEAVLVGFHEYRVKFINNLLNLIIIVPLFFYLIITYAIWGVMASLIAYRVLLFIKNFSSTLSTKLLATSNNSSLADSREVRHLFKTLSLPVVFSGLTVAPVLAIAFKLVSMQEDGMKKLAFFNIAYQVYLIAIFIPSALNGYFISRFSKRDKAVGMDFKKIGFYNLLFSIVVVIALLIFQNIIFWFIDSKNPIFINNYYIMLGAIIFYSINAVYASVWPSINRAWIGFIMNIVWAITLISITYILSVFEIAEALSWGFLISYLVLSIVQFLSLKKY